MTSDYWAESVLSETGAVRQHYVPRMLLVRFETGGSVPVYEIETGRTFQASVNNIAVESRIYDVKLGEDVVSSEGWLATLEGHTAPLIERIVSSPGALLGLSAEEENTLARFIDALHSRVPAQREIDSELRNQLLRKTKEIGRAWLDTQLPPAAAQDVWDVWSKKPDKWFLHEEEPYQPAATTASMLGDVQGYANILRGMPWRIGLADPSLSIYSSDNPVARHPLSTFRWAGFALHVYYVPLSPHVVLKIGPGLSPEGSVERVHADFSPWETSLIRHIVSSRARRHLYGSGPYVPRECATGCLRRIDAVTVACAVVLQDFDPSILR